MSRLPLDSWVVIPSPPGGIQCFIWGGSAPGFNPLSFYELLLANKAPLSYALH